MSVDRNIYIGWYLKVWMPKETVDSGKATCQECGNSYYGSINFCSECGGRLVPETTEEPCCFEDYIEEAFGEEQYEFYNAYRDPYTYRDFVIVMPNVESMDWGKYVDEYALEQAININDPELEPKWKRLVERMESDHIKYAVKCGVVNYTS